MAAWDKTIRLAGEKPKLKNIKVGYSTDNNLDDAGDDLVYDSDFSTSSTTVSHDDNGSLAVEGVFIYRYAIGTRISARGWRSMSLGRRRQRLTSWV